MSRRLTLHRLYPPTRVPVVVAENSVDRVLRGALSGPCCDWSVAAEGPAQLIASCVELAENSAPGACSRRRPMLAPVEAAMERPLLRQGPS